MMNVYMRQNAVFKHGILQDIKIVIFLGKSFEGFEYYIWGFICNTIIRECFSYK